MNVDTKGDHLGVHTHVHVCGSHLVLKQPLLTRLVSRRNTWEAL